MIDTTHPEGRTRQMGRLEWGVLFSLLLSAASAIFSTGVIWTTVQVHEREITQLKATNSETTDRLARIETKLDIVIEERRKPRME